TVVKWLSGESMSFLDLVKGILHIEVKQFSESVIKRQTEILEEAITSFPGETTTDKVRNFWKDGEIKGDELKTLLENDLQKKSSEVGQLFKDKVFSVLGQSVTDNGVEYKAVTDKPWGAYNWYLGGFKSLNEFNVDKPFKKSNLLSTIYHEYEHHVSNLWREQKYIDTNNLELSIVPLHTGRCVICEGTADTAMDFLQVMENSPQNKVEIALYGLTRMAQINAAIMLNHEGKSLQDAADYLVATDMRTEKQAFGILNFMRATKTDGAPNFWGPYIFTYYLGRTDFVKPTFTKAIENDALQEFYRTVYLNPYSGSSVTWEKAFEWL
ncbi:MAG: hypothetical protein ACTSU3_02075, partial [Candidatus Thorarchaeota archaeon]